MQEVLFGMYHSQADGSPCRAPRDIQVVLIMYMEASVKVTVNTVKNVCCNEPKIRTIWHFM